MADAKLRVRTTRPVTYPYLGFERATLPARTTADGSHPGPGEGVTIRVDGEHGDTYGVWLAPGEFEVIR